MAYLHNEVPGRSFANRMSPVDTDGCLNNQAIRPGLWHNFSNASHKVRDNFKDLQLKGLFWLGQQLQTRTTATQLCMTALELVVETLPTDAALLFLKKDDQLILENQAHKNGTLPPVDPTLDKTGQYLCELSVFRSQPIYIEDITCEHSSQICEPAQKTPISYAALPLCLNGDTLGCIVLVSFVQKRNFGDSSAFLEAFAAQLAQGLGFLRLQVEVGSTKAQLSKTVAALEQEVADRKSLEQAFYSTTARLESIFRAAPIGIGLVIDRVLVEVNDRICKMTGRSRKELIGQSALILYPSQADYEYVGKEKYRQMNAQGVGSVETRWRQKDGSVIDVLLNSVPLNPKNLKAGITFSALDITDRKVLFEKVQNSHMALEQRVAERTTELALKNRELETFAFSVSHDLKVPLRAVDGYSRLLENKYNTRLDDEGVRFIQYIRKSAHQMDQLIEGLLAYFRLELNKSGSESLNPLALVRDLVAPYLEEMRTKKAIVSFEIAEAKITADANALSIALQQLIDNAVKFSKCAPRPTIMIGGRPNCNGFVFWVRDNGKGFDMRYHDRIFDIFQRLDRFDEFSGTGIGLAMVRKAVGHLKGRCWAQSETDRGATFYLEIPQ